MGHVANQSYRTGLHHYLFNTPLFTNYFLVLSNYLLLSTYYLLQYRSAVFTS